MGRSNEISDMVNCRVISDPRELPDVAPFGDEDYWSLFTARLVESHVDESGYTPIGGKEIFLPRVPTPPVLARIAMDYFNSVDKNPLITHGYYRGSEHEIRKPRPYTWAGLDEYLAAIGIAIRTGTLKNRPVQVVNGETLDYTKVLADVGNIMWRQKFDGAVAGVFNAQIIARDLRLAEVVETTISGEISQTIDYAKLSDDEIEKLYEIMGEQIKNATTTKT